MMRKFLLLFLCACGAAAAEEPATDEMAVAEAGATEAGAEEAAAGDRNGDGIEAPKTMSGMSILGNEEAPKALVIVPWKSSELGNEIALTDTLDVRATPIDRDVFLRELRFYEIRTGE